MRKKVLYFMLVPGILIILFFLMAPLINILIPTVVSDKGITPKLYLSFFKDSYLMNIFFRTLRIAIITTIVCMILGVPVSYYLSRSDKKIRGLLLALTVFPLLTNSIVRAFAWMTILGKNGAINTLLINCHIISEPREILYTEFAIIIGSVYLFLPLMIVSLVGVMENINSDFVEAAQSLGASRIAAFFKVIFPLSVPGMIVGSILVFTGALTAYTTPQLLGGNKNTVLATLIYQKAMTLSDWTGASVVSAVMIIATLIVMFGINKFASRLYERGV
ncbi:ABC transporter permease [Clostridium sp. 001]|uniref:ABC transporter permease n=1 Tax=Clostridium sp. 001 TaxID=1970093 RepID=UPI001C2C427D|nr:ABC transporter permease [Clostridium sp. 001]QXE17906.1 spermidine/putrescine ABC transporter permease [Clostridium sp. 001]